MKTVSYKIVFSFVSEYEAKTFNNKDRLTIVHIMTTKQSK